jgi:hypothetical protein
VYAECDKKSSHHKYGLDTKFFHKIHLALKNLEELGISDEQIEKIKTLKVNTKKDLIKRKAKIDLIKVDIKNELWGDTIDKERIYKLIDQKYEQKKEKAKALIDACDMFKKILTNDQKKKLREVYSKGFSN